MTSDWTMSHRWLIRWLALLLPVVVGAVLGIFRASMDSSTAAMVLVLAVVAASATGDRITGVVAALSAAASFDFFFTVPYHSLTISNSEDVELAVVLVIVGLAVTEIALWGRRQQAAALRREGYLHGLADLLELGPDTSADTHARAIATAITHALGADRTEWMTGQPQAHDAIVGADGTVQAGGRMVPVQRIGLPTDSYTTVPVRWAGQVVGHFRVVTSTRVVRPTAEQLRVAVLLADRMAGVYDGDMPTGSPTPR
ncbi:DUF4118 domain-containing protein [Monashia sp. NPDC004114]